VLANVWVKCRYYAGMNHGLCLNYIKNHFDISIVHDEEWLKDRNVLNLSHDYRIVSFDMASPKVNFFDILVRSRANVGTSPA
jgi:hypothetical protein